MRALIDQGPFPPDEALRVGLVDDLAYADQIDDKAQAAVAASSHASSRTTTPRWIAQVARAQSRPEDRRHLRHRRDHVRQRRLRPVARAPCSGSETINEHIREARNDPSVRAIVLRIDSPGGSATASDAIWRELVITRDEKNDRPLVVSMSDLAASGGYWIAMAAPYIVAQPGTLTGFDRRHHRQDRHRRRLHEARRQYRRRQQRQARRAGLAGAAVHRRGAQKVESLMQDTYDEFIEKAAAARGT